MEKDSTRALKNENKKIFLVASSNRAMCELITTWINLKIENALVYTALDDVDCFQKIGNAMPLVLISDFILDKSNSVQNIKNLLEDAEYDQLPIIIIGGENKKSEYVDEVVTGKVQFIDELVTEEDLFPFLNRAMNFANALSPSNYKVKYLNAGDTLIREGEKADHVYILKKGELRATKMQNNHEVVLGSIYPGEFVGEMGFLNSMVRVATVKAVKESQVVSIPTEIFEKVIFKRPAWAKTILTTLSKRLSMTLKKPETKD